MKIIQQISEDTFVIKLDDYDLHPKDIIRIAHDYVEFDGPVWIQSDTDKVDKLTGKYIWCTNWISTLG